MSFPPGKPILAMTVLSLLSGGALLLHRPAAAADYTVWVFDPNHARILRGDLGDTNTLIDQYRRQTGRSVEVRLVNARALDIRLLSLFNSAPQTQDVPDLVEVELGSVGKYFRGRPQDVGFLPLNGYLERSGWLPHLLLVRLAPWSKDGVIFGIPHDVHPVAITYRKDLFDQAGVDLASARTWPQFQAAGLRFQSYWQAHGYPQRMALELPRASADRLVLMLQQQHIDLLDSDLTIHLADPKVAQTLAFYAQCVAGDRRIAAPAAPGPAWVEDLGRGDICAAMTADWRLDALRGTPALRGKLGLMPLPVFDEEDLPTATWGGTMIGIPKACPHPDEAWKLLEFLYLSPQAMEARRRYSDILPPLPGAWNDPVYHRPPAADSVFVRGKIDGFWVPDEMLTYLAALVPPARVTAYTTTASATLGVVLHRAVAYVDANGPAGLESACDDWLSQAAEDLRRRIAFAQDPQ